MARVNRKSLRADADFTEDTVGLAIDSFLATLAFPRQRFTVDLFSKEREHFLGADARVFEQIEGFKPFYMQFKRPSAYPDSSFSRIIRHRRSLSPALAVTPRALFFDLRKKQPRHRDFQHNVLFKLRRRLQRTGLGDAAYVCPLFLERTAYREHMHQAGVWRWRPWRLAPWDSGQVDIEDPRGFASFRNVPLLAEHVSIPPHAPVTHANHSYSFTEEGAEVCFHSPETLPEGGGTTARWIESQLPSLEGPLVHVEDAAAMFRKLFGGDMAGEELDVPKDLLAEQYGLRAWLGWGHHLRETYAIEQFAFIRWKEAPLKTAT